MEKMNVSGVARDNNCARVAIINLPDEPGVAFKVFSLLAKHKVNIDIILQSVGRDDTKDISFTVDLASVEEAVSILDGLKKLMNAHDIQVDTGVAKVSIVGAGMATNSGVAAKMFEALADAGINIQMISTSEIKISVIIDKKDADRAVQVIHEAFIPEK